MNQFYQQPPENGWQSPPEPFFEWQWHSRRTQEKRSLRRSINGVGAGMLLIELIGTVLVLVITGILGVLFPGADQNGVYYQGLEYCLYAPIAVGVPFIIAAKIDRRGLGELIPFQKHGKGLGIACVMQCFLLVAVGNFIAGIISINFPQMEENVTALMGNDPTNGMELLVTLLQMAVIPALVEEFAFRGVVLGMLRPYGDWFAIITSAFCFGIIHGNFIQFPFAFFLGIGLGYAVVRTGSLVPAIAVHFINNATSCVITYIQPYLNDEWNGIIGFMLYLAWVVVGVIGFLILQVRYRQPPTPHRRPHAYAGALSLSDRISTLFTGVLWLLAVGMYLLVSFAMAV